MKIKIGPLTHFFSVISSYHQCDIKVSRHDGGLSLKMGKSKLLFVGILHKTSLDTDNIFASYYLKWGIFKSKIHKQIKKHLNTRHLLIKTSKSRVPLRHTIDSSRMPCCYYQIAGEKQIFLNTIEKQLTNLKVTILKEIFESLVKWMSHSGTHTGRQQSMLGA